MNYSTEIQTKKITLLGTRLDHELCHIFRSMFPGVTIKNYADAMSAALKAAVSRVSARQKSLKDRSKETPHQTPRKKKIAADFYEGIYKRHPENINPSQGYENTPPERQVMRDS
ncbi:GSCOCG00000744001-RA-CDS [Cotesia congregata]|nr:GSCOCG00000744001-RA-CDS [Cotesia congregata]